MMITKEERERLRAEWADCDPMIMVLDALAAAEARAEAAERERDVANRNNAALRCQLDEAQIATLRAQDEAPSLTDEEIAGSFERMLDRRVSFDPDGEAVLEPWEREDANHTINRLAATLATERAAREKAERERDAAYVNEASEVDARVKAEAACAVMREALAPFVCTHPWKCAEPGAQAGCDAKRALATDAGRALLEERDRMREAGAVALAACQANIAYASRKDEPALCRAIEALRAALSTGGEG